MDPLEPEVEPEMKHSASSGRSLSYCEEKYLYFAIYL